MNSRGEAEIAKPTKRILTKKVYCEECGWAYRHRVQNKKDYWVCSRKGNAGYECEGPNLLEKEIYSAFVRMYNKLRYYESEILDSALTLMNELRTKLMADNEELRQIDVEIAKICDQTKRYEKYRERKIMDC